MRNTLRNLFLAPAVLAVATVAAISAHADANLKVPFAFNVAGKQLPAGDYVVTEDQRVGSLTLRSKATSQSFSWIVGPGDAGRNTHTATMKFNANAAGYTLRSVQYGPRITPRLDGGKKHSEHVPVETVTGQ